MRWVIVALLLGGAWGAGVNGTAPSIVAVAPNPATANDDGEFLVVAAPTRTNLTGWTLTDGETTVQLPNRTVRGRVTLSTRPAAARNLTGRRVLALDGRLALANAGETIRLRDGSRTVDAVSYDRAPEGETYARTDAGWAWRPTGATDLPIVRARNAPVRAFVLPDAAGTVPAALGAARERILLAGYTLTSARVTRSLCAARARGVEVRVAVEAQPVGGTSRQGARALDALVECGAVVRALGAERPRYAYYHAKYAVIDDRALVLTENWKPRGTGGRSSRGWGVVVEDPTVAAALARTFAADAAGRDAVAWRRFRAGKRFARDDPPAGDRFPSRFAVQNVATDRVTVLVAPDNAEPAVIALLDGANESIGVQQMTIGGPDQPFLRAAVRAARRGVRVRILLSGAWYVADDNRRLAARLNDRARREGLPLEARVADPRSRYEKIHTKGIVVDRESVAIGSLNWNNASARQNREVVVVLRGREVGRYYARVFRADWRGGVWHLPIGLAAVTVVIGFAGGWVVRRSIRFEPD